MFSVLLAKALLSSSEAILAVHTGVPMREYGPPCPAIVAALTRFQDKNQIPGLCFTITSKGKLVYVFERGYADAESKQPFSPRTRIQIASISKVPTALAVMKLLESKHISLKAPAMPFLKIDDAQAKSNISMQPYSLITFRDLLEHSAGFGSEFNPWSRPGVAKALHVSMPVLARQTVGFELRKPLSFQPGTKYEYSNFGYLLLGRLIEDLSGQPYAQFVQKEIFQPFGLERMQIRHSQESHQLEDECHYYEEPAKLYTSLFPEDNGKKVPMMYGGAIYEQADACSAWVSDSADLARFGSALASPKVGKILSNEMLRQVAVRPPYVGNARQFKGLGVDVELSEDGKSVCFRHGGDVPGATSFLSSNFAGDCMTLVMNKSVEGRSLQWEVHQELMNALCARSWEIYPDLFALFKGK